MLRPNRLENVCSQQILGYFRASAKPTLSVWHHEVLHWIRLWAYSTTFGSPENTTEGPELKLILYQRHWRSKSLWRSTPGWTFLSERRGRPSRRSKRSKRKRKRSYRSSGQRRTSWKKSRISLIMKCNKAVGWMSLGQMSVDNVTSIPLPIVSAEATLPLASALLFAELSCRKKM